jgi:hypothetical protein
MSRPDEYSIKLDRVKNQLMPKLIELYEETLQIITEVKLLPDYEEHATVLEKSNLDVVEADCVEDIEYFSNFVWK